MKIYNEYQNVNLYEIQHFINQGYEPIHFYSESASYIQQVNGDFMNNPISLNIPFISVTQKVVIGRTTAAKLLYEKELKGENNT